MMEANKLRAAAIAGLLVATSCGGATPTREAGPRTVLKAPLTAAEGYEAIMQDSYFLANTAVPRHYHPGEEYTYVIEGEITLIEDGEEERLIRAGEAFEITAGKIHAARTGDIPARAITFRVHREGEPERVLVE